MSKVLMRMLIVDEHTKEGFEMFFDTLVPTQISLAQAESLAEAVRKTVVEFSTSAPRNRVH